MSFVGIETRDLREIADRLGVLLDVYWPTIAPNLGPDLERLWWRGADSSRRYELAADVDRAFAHLGDELDQVRRLIDAALRAQALASAPTSPGHGWPTGPGTQFG